MLLLKSSLEQLHRVNKEYRKSRKEDICGDNIANIMYIRNVLDDDASGKHTIDTYDNSIKESRDPEVAKQVPKNIHNIYEQIPDGRNTSKPRSILTAGTFIDTDKVKGYVSRIDGSTIVIEQEGTGDMLKLKLSEFLKLYKKETPAVEMTVPGQAPVPTEPEKKEVKKAKADKKNESTLTVKSFGDFVNESKVNVDVQTKLDELQKKYPAIKFTLEPNTKFGKDSYFAKVEIKKQNGEYHYLGALKGPVSSEHAIDFFERTAEKNYDKFY